MRASSLPSIPPPISELPVIDAEPFERADAARNRRRVLEAAQRLFDRDGVDCTSMDAIATEAGVGKGTLFRRFGDRASLIAAVLTDRESNFQNELIRGAPPLGPGVCAVERLVAFGHARLDVIERHGDLIASMEQSSGADVFRSAVYASYHMHVALLVREGAPDLDADLIADALLATLGGQLTLHQLHDRQVPIATLHEQWEALARRVLAPPLPAIGKPRAARG